MSDDDTIYNVAVTYRGHVLRLMQLSGKRESIIAAMHIVLDSAPLWQEVRYADSYTFEVRATRVTSSTATNGRRKVAVVTTRKAPEQTSQDAAGVDSAERPVRVGVPPSGETAGEPDASTVGCDASNVAVSPAAVPFAPDDDWTLTSEPASAICPRCQWPMPSPVSGKSEETT